MVEFGTQHLQKAKLAVHVVQGALAFVSFCLDIAVIRSTAKIDGRVGWNVGVCWLTVIPIIYLTMTPRFPRTRKFANPYALAVTDCLFCILWLSAFATVANWNGSGKCGNGCGLAKGVVAIGVFNWLFWILTSFMSLYGVVYYKREGYLPGFSRAPTNAQTIDPDKEAFSTAPHVDEYAPVHNTDDPEVGPSGIHYGSDHEHGQEGYSGSYGGGYVPPQVHDEPTEYGGTQGAYDGRAQFPTGRYDNA